MKKNPILLFAAAFLSAFLTGCGMLSADEETPLPLSGTLWRPEELPDGGPAPVPGADVRLIFRVDGKLGGSTGDNRFYGGYRLSSGGGMRIGALSVTWRNGPNRAYEERFLSILRLTAFYSIRGDVLTLLDGQHRILALFRGQAGCADGI